MWREKINKKFTRFHASNIVYMGKEVGDKESKGFQHNIIKEMKLEDEDGPLVFVLSSSTS